jgi:hypothetical protein
MISCLANKPYVPLGLAMIVGLKKHGYNLDGVWGMVGKRCSLFHFAT